MLPLITLLIISDIGAGVELGLESPLLLCGPLGKPHGSVSGMAGLLVGFPCDALLRILDAASRLASCLNSLRTVFSTKEPNESIKVDGRDPVGGLDFLVDCVGSMDVVGDRFAGWTLLVLLSAVVLCVLYTVVEVGDTLAEVARPP